MKRQSHPTLLRPSLNLSTSCGGTLIALSSLKSERPTLYRVRRVGVRMCSCHRRRCDPGWSPVGLSWEGSPMDIISRTLPPTRRLLEYFTDAKDKKYPQSLLQAKQIIHMVEQSPEHSIFLRALGLLLQAPRAMGNISGVVQE